MALPPNGRIVDSRRRDAAEWWHYQQAMEAYLDVLIFNRFLTDQIQTLGSSSFSSFSSLHCLSPNQPPRRGGRPTTHQVCRSVPEVRPRGLSMGRALTSASFRHRKSPKCTIPGTIPKVGQRPRREIRVAASRRSKQSHPKHFEPTPLVPRRTALGQEEVRLSIRTRKLGRRGG